MYVKNNLIVRPSLQSRPNKASLRYSSVCPYVCASTKRFFDLNEIWHVGRGRRVMHDGMQYDLIHDQGYEPFKVGNLAIFKSYLFRHLQWELANDH